ncbi:MAG: undecaprenyldiphospho-muramoylpentapeptide beta-N-acetylglucosaminyltransferase [bacterium]
MNLKNKKYPSRPPRRVEADKILLTGGGTGGSVSPLLATAEELKICGNFEFLWLGTKFGPEREMVERAGIKFMAISGGKLRRYFSFKNFFDIFKIKIAFWQALFIMLKSRPDLAMSAGSFVSVPAIWAAWILRVPILIHQQDVAAGLANKLMAPFAKAVTVVFESSLKDYGKKAVWIGNPVRRSLKTQSINKDFPAVLILGGGTGSAAINKLVENSISELAKFCRVAHITGKNKGGNTEVKSGNYERYEFLGVEKMAEIMNAADLVITRAGIGMLSELSYLGKPCVIIPMPNSHQEENAEFFKNKNAAIVLEQKNLTPENFAALIKDLLADKEALAGLSANMAGAMKKGANQSMAKIIKNLLK